MSQFWLNNIAIGRSLPHISLQHIQFTRESVPSLEYNDFLNVLRILATSASPDDPDTELLVIRNLIVQASRKGTAQTCKDGDTSRVTFNPVQHNISATDRSLNSMKDERTNRTMSSKSRTNSVDSDDSFLVLESRKHNRSGSSTVGGNYRSDKSNFSPSRYERESNVLSDREVAATASVAMTISGQDLAVSNATTKQDDGIAYGDDYLPGMDAVRVHCMREDLGMSVEPRKYTVLPPFAIQPIPPVDPSRSVFSPNNRASRPRLQTVRNVNQRGPRQAQPLYSQYPGNILPSTIANDALLPFECEPTYSVHQYRTMPTMKNSRYHPRATDLSLAHSYVTQSSSRSNLRPLSASSAASVRNSGRLIGSQTDGTTNNPGLLSFVATSSETSYDSGDPLGQSQHTGRTNSKISKTHAKSLNSSTDLPLVLPNRSRHASTGTWDPIVRRLSGISISSTSTHSSSNSPLDISNRPALLISDLPMHQPPTNTELSSSSDHKSFDNSDITSSVMDVKTDEGKSHSFPPLTPRDEKPQLDVSCIQDSPSTSNTNQLKSTHSPTRIVRKGRPRSQKAKIVCSIDDHGNTEVRVLSLDNGTSIPPSSTLHQPSSRSSISHSPTILGNALSSPTVASYNSPCKATSRTPTIGTAAGVHGDPSSHLVQTPDNATKFGNRSQDHLTVSTSKSAIGGKYFQNLARIENASEDFVHNPTDDMHCNALVGSPAKNSEGEHLQLNQAPSKGHRAEGKINNTSGLTSYFRKQQEYSKVARDSIDSKRTIALFAPPLAPPVTSLRYSGADISFQNAQHRVERHSNSDVPPPSQHSMPLDTPNRPAHPIYGPSLDTRTLQGNSQSKMSTETNALGRSSQPRGSYFARISSQTVK